MAQVRMVLTPEELGLGIEYEGGVIQLGHDDEIVITGLPDGVRGSDGKPKPSMMFAFRLPTGDLAVAELSWRSFAAAYQAFFGKFGEPDMVGMQVAADGHVIEFAASEKPFVQCGECGWRLDAENTPASLQHMLREWQRHYRKRHPKVEPPTIPGLD